MRLAQDLDPQRIEWKTMIKKNIKVQQLKTLKINKFHSSRFKVKCPPKYQQCKGNKSYRKSKEEIIILKFDKAIQNLKIIFDI